VDVAEEAAALGLRPEELGDVDLVAGATGYIPPTGCIQKLPCWPRSRGNLMRAAATPYLKAKASSVPMWPLRR
jgi:hypothetical protein